MMFASLTSTPCLLGWTLAWVCAAAWGQAEPAPAAAAIPARIQVIELPAPAGPLPGALRQRSHHALSIATDAPKPFLRSLGLDASECSMRLRLPSRLGASREAASGLKLDLQLQAGLGCKF